MRPTRLELEGFTTYREPVEIDFDGADLFALVGPTGAGKTAVLDGMVFALYGTVPRLEDKRKVEPVITAGKLEAKVRFDFTVGDRTYTAVRVVRRTKTGATTKEARLESGDEVLAGSAQEVTETVEGVLGLAFEQFTKCVVLPQGEFARFLHDKPRDRQELIVRLLELDLYERMRARANERAAHAEGQAKILASHLEELAATTKEALAAATGRVETLEALRADADEAQPRLDSLAEAARQAQADRAEAAERAALLEKLAMPEAVPELSGRLAAADRALAAARRRQDEAEAAVAAADRTLTALPDRGELVALRQAHEQRGRLAERISKGEAVVQQRRGEEREAKRRLDQADEALKAAERELAATRNAHAAHALSSELRVGEPCPVCDQPVGALPRRERPADLDAAEAALTRAAVARDAAARAHKEAGEARAEADQLLAGLREQLDECDRLLAGKPGPEEVTARITEVEAAKDTLDAARAQEQAARQALRDAERAREAVAKAENKAWQDFDQARDTVGGLHPPSASRDDLAGSWRALLDWARQTATSSRKAAAAAAERGQEAAAERQRVLDELAERCRRAGVEVGDQRLRDAVADALAEAAQARERLAEDLQRKAALEQGAKAERERADVARLLGQHLAANRFERWLLDEALQRLASGASARMLELSGGQYSLVVDEQRDFGVIDHLNAGERRPARTLSGGETFLASLALALTLAEQVAELAAAGTPRLESIFLDEGFGTLDAATLDVVAAAIEELGASGRTVGVISHVPELGDRLPVRFEVRKTPTGSTVTKVVA